MEKTVYKQRQLCFTKAFWVSAVLFFAVSKGFAQTTPVVKTDTTRKLKEVKVSNTPDVNTLTPTQQVNANDFIRTSAYNVADAIRDFAGLNIKDYGGIGGLKTVSVRSLSANHLAVLYDGVALSDAENGQIDLGKLNLNNVQSITLYNAQPPQICQPARAFASASVLAITTLKPKLDSIKAHQLTAGIGGGSFGLINPYLQWQQRINKQWSFVVNGYAENANGKYKYKLNRDGSDTLATRTNDDVAIQQTDGALYWAKSDSSKFNLHLNFYHSNNGQPGAVIFYNPYSVARLQNRDFFIQSGYEHVWQNSLHLLINSKYSQDYLRYLDRSYPNNAGGLDEQYMQREFYQSAALAYSIAQNWQVAYAIDAAYAKLGANLPNYLYPIRFTLLNVLSSNLTLGKWLFQGNLLQTNTNDRVDRGNAADPVSVLLPTIVVNYQANQNLQLRAFYKSSFRESTFNEQYFFAVLQIRDIKPEYAKQFDAGINYSKKLDGALNYIALTADAYFNRVTNLIVSLPQSPVMSSVFNAGQVDIKGVDFGIKTEATLSSTWKAAFKGTYTYQQALNVTDPTDKRQIPYTPKNEFAANLGVFDTRLSFFYNQTYSSSRYYINDNSPEYNVPGFAIGDVTGMYRFLAKDKPMSLSATVNNVFNTNYYIINSYPMAGRSVRLSLQITI